MTTDTQPIRIFNRYTQSMETESIYGESYLKFIYNNPLGQWLRWAIVSRYMFSAWYGWRMDRKNSRSKILPFIEKYHLDPTEWVKQPESFSSFNDFFMRELKPEARPIDPEPDTVIFPADGRHLAFPDISQIQGVFVKGQSFHLDQLLQSPSWANRYRRGSLMISRLAPVDYHHFHWCADGQATHVQAIHSPTYSSVNPIALRQHLSILWENKRVITELQSEKFGHILCIEIGATCVGRIRQRFKVGDHIQKGDAKGYFMFGGSTTLLLFEPNRVVFDADLLHHSAQHVEVYAQMGDRCATAAV